MEKQKKALKIDILRENKIGWVGFALFSALCLCISREHLFYI